MTFGITSRDNNEENTETAIDTNSFVERRGDVKFYLVYVDWSEWGRTSRDCAGWGLCNFNSCTFCCIDENTGNIVSCNQQNRFPRSCKIVLYEDNIGGYLEIRLDKSLQEENNAIINKLTLFIDNDIINDGIKLHKGEYKFD